MNSPYAQSSSSIYEQGYAPIPLMPREKRPGDYSSGTWRGMKNWTEFSDVGEGQVLEWQDWPDANIGVLHTDLFGAVDFDEDTAGCHEEIKSILAELDGAIVRRKGSKGYIQYFRLDGSLRSRKYQINKVNALEFLARGNQSVLPPSIHPDTRSPYVWLTEDSLEDIDLDELPLITRGVMDDIEAILRRSGWQAEKVDVEQRRSVAQGDEPPLDSINGFVNWHSMQDFAAWVPELSGLDRLIRRGNGGYAGVALWRSSGTGRPSEKRKRNLSISPHGIKDFGTGETFSPIDLVMRSENLDLDAAGDWLFERVGEKSTPFSFPDLGITRSEDPHEFDLAITKMLKGSSKIDKALSFPVPVDMSPFDHSKTKGVIGAIAEHTLRSSRKPCPEYAMMAGISAASVFYGRKFLTPTRSGLTMFCVAVGASGSGKNDPNRVLKTCFDPDIQKVASNRCDFLGKFLGSGDISSDQAMWKTLIKKPSVLMVQDEFGLFLRSMQGFKASAHSERVKSAMLQLHGLSPSRWFGRVTAGDDEDRQEHIYNPNYAVMGTTTPETMFNGITEENLSDGLVARMLFFIPRYRPKFNRPSHDDMEVPQQLADLLCESARIKNESDGGTFNHGGYMSDTVSPQHQTVVPFADKEAEQDFFAIEEWADELLDHPHVSAGVINRLSEHTIRLATLRAISRYGANAMVSRTDISWGAGIVRSSLLEIMTSIEGSMHVNDHARNKAAMKRGFLDAAKDSEDGIVSLGSVTRILPHLSKRDIFDCVDRLLIEEFMIEHQGVGSPAKGSLNKTYKIKKEVDDQESIT